MSTAFKSQFKTRARLAAALALGVAAALPAHADKTVFITLAYSGGTTQSATVSDTIGYVGSFVDDFVFQIPPPASFVTLSSTAGTGVTFTSVALLTYGTLTSNPLVGSFSASAFSESASPPVPSAVYVLEIKGASASATAAYTGGIGASPVPEPAGWALMSLGLAGMAARLRRRRADGQAVGSL